MGKVKKNKIRRKYIRCAYCWRCQSGLALAFGLIRESVSNILVVDKNKEGIEGPWVTFARMKTLRTPKHVIGPEWNIPSLSMRAWYTAKCGKDAWEELHLLPKGQWQDYLIWFRQTLNLPVQNEVEVGASEWDEENKCFKVAVSGNVETKFIWTKKVILATGIEGSGKWNLPQFIKDNLPENKYSHTRGDIDFNALKGKRVGVLGAGASAFDNASVALEEGAKSLDLFFRRKEIVRVNPYRWCENVGFLKHHRDLSDEDRWKFILKILQIGQLPPEDTYHRAKQFDSFKVHPGSPWTSVGMKGDEIEVVTPKGTFYFDFVIIGTGFMTDLASRKELDGLSDKIMLWEDKYSPKKEDAQADLSRHPYLGENFEYLPKNENDKYISGIFNFTFGGLLSMGFGGGSISGMKYSMPQLVSGITKQLYMEDQETLFDDLCNYDDTEF